MRRPVRAVHAPLLVLLAIAGAARAEPVPFDPRYVIEVVEIRGNSRTETALIEREIGLGPGDVITPGDPRVDRARLRLMSLGYFLDVRASLSRGQRRGSVVLVFEVEERGTVIINALQLGTSEATPIWGGLDVTQMNAFGRGLALGGGFVASATPRVEEAAAAQAFALRASGPSSPGIGLSLSGQALWTSGSEFFRAAGDRNDPDPANFVAVQLRRAGGAVGVAADLSPVARLGAEGRFEAIAADLPEIRTQAVPSGARVPIEFGVIEGESQLASLGATLDLDTRSDPVLPSGGHRLVLAVEASSPLFGSSYAFAKGIIQSSSYFPVVRDHVLGLHGFVGGIFGEAPTFERFFIGDLNLLLPPRALGLNFSTQPSRAFLGDAIAEHRYDDFAGRVLVEYAVPLWRRRGFLYRGDAFVALGAFAMASADDLRVRDQDLTAVLPLDLTADLGIRLDTYVGIFTLSVANALGRIPL